MLQVTGETRRLASVGILENGDRILAPAGWQHALELSLKLLEALPGACAILVRD